ncbi:MAG: BamA/TamA family outer membrane protein [Acidobacteriaceae bacterium]|nr:BamA/TamA family outer membrane protein [Acidobacteriaceae bacterium]
MRTLEFFGRSVLLCGLVLWANLSLLRAQNFSGKTVISVEYEPAAQAADARDLANFQLVRVGEPLQPNQVAATIDRLFASGLYDDIQVDAEARGDGVALRFLTRPRRFIGHVGAHGQIKDPPSRAIIISDAQLQLGTPFDVDTLEDARKSIENELKDNGLYQATVGVATIEDPDTHQVTIRFLVNAGKRAKYEMPVIRGDTKLPNETIVHATGWRVPLIHRWRQVTAVLTDKGIDGVEKRYAKADRLTASVDLTSLDYDPATNRAKGTFDINAGPKITIKALEAKVSKGKLRQYVPVYQEGSVDNDLLTEGARNLHDYFQAKGYPDVDVTFRREAVQNDEETINYYIATGPRRRLVDVKILGSDYFEMDTLRERMFLRPATLVMRYGRYSEDFRKKDEEAIENLYQANGFRDVKVSSRVETNYKGKESDIAVIFHIDQGPQWTVANLTVSGVSQLDLTPLRDQLASAEGQPYADVNIASDRSLILGYYYSHGFPSATFRYATSAGPDAHTNNLVYEIGEGRRQFVRKVLISGLYRTRPALVEKRITLQDGEPVSITKVNDIARELTDLGIFANVNTALQDANGTNQYKYVLYDFDEAARYTFNIGLGLEVGQFGGTTNNLAQAGGAKGTSPIVSFEVNRLNFLGLGQTISLQARYSTLEQRESLNYIIPHFLSSLNRTLTFTVLYDTTQDVQTFRVRREEAAVQTSQRLNRASTVLLRFAYTRDAPNVTIPALNTAAFTSPVRIGELSASFIQDHRDNPADAHRGFWNTVDTGIAGHFFGSQRNFYRLLARNATYTSLGRNLVFARQTQIGGIIPFSIPSNLNTFNVIPLPERFFGGGSVSMRGFGDNQAGPRDTGNPSELPTVPANPTATGFPIGGDGLFFNTFELRFPLLYPNLSGVVFHDMGNIYNTFSDISLSYHQKRIEDFNYAVQAAGFGIRYKTPLGPVRVDLAYTLNPPNYLGFNRNETVQQLLSCTAGQIGNPAFPNCDASRQRLGHFQFFFSIGQAF